MNTPWETPPCPEDPRDDDEREQAMHAADARDAARYRFLRQAGNAIVYAKDRHAWGKNASGHVRYDTPEQLDAAVDVARSAETVDGEPHA